MLAEEGEWEREQRNGIDKERARERWRGRAMARESDGEGERWRGRAMARESDGEGERWRGRGCVSNSSFENAYKIIPSLTSPKVILLCTVKG